MIKYALGCAGGHEFESWFPDSDAYEKQRKQGQVACPQCGSAEVEKAIMAPAVVGGDRAPAESPVEAMADDKHGLKGEKGAFPTVVRLLLKPTDKSVPHWNP